MGQSRPSRATLFALAATTLASTACGSVRELEDVSYDRRHSDARLDVYLPDGGGSRRPGVMMIHGGAWTFGDKRHFAGTGRRLARSGYVAASINYRLLPEGAYPRMFQDCWCALAYLQASADEYDLDPDRIVVMGYSAGGHLAALLGAAWAEDDFAPDCEAGRPRAPAGAIPGAGMYDARKRKDVTLLRDLMGGSYESVPERWERASPLLQVDGDEPPFLMVVGGADWLADEAQLGLMKHALGSHGVEARVLEIAGGGHLLNPVADPGELLLATSLDTPEAWIAIADFLERTVGPP